MNVSALNLLSNIVENIMVLKKTNRSHEVKFRLTEMISQGETSFEMVDSQIKKEAKYWILLGKMYSCSNHHMQKAIQALETASKLDPELIEPWNELGEIYWSSLEVNKAQRCFEKALGLTVNKVSLRNLSVVRREQAQDKEAGDESKVYDSALVLAKRALDLDPTDGHSWSTLGNSYLAAFFCSPLKRQYILQAVTCFTQAERNLEVEDRLDVYYHKGVALKHLENYPTALDHFLKCIEGDETWKLPSKMYDGLVLYLDLIKENIVKKGNLKPARYKNILKVLDHSLNRCNPNIKAKHACNDVDGMQYLYGIVLWTVEVDDSFPVTIGLLKSNGAVKVVTIFNLSVSRKFLKVGDFLTIRNPMLEEIDFFHKKKYEFSKARVDDPTSLLVNNMNLPKFCYAKYNFETSPS